MSDRLTPEQRETLDRGVEESGVTEHGIPTDEASDALASVVARMVAEAEQRGREDNAGPRSVLRVGQQSTGGA